MANCSFVSLRLSSLLFVGQEDDWLAIALDDARHDRGRRMPSETGAGIGKAAQAM
jgi:hypothetical protein